MGPHRDDIIFYINDLEATKYASQGQQRTIVLALKLSELDIITDKTGDEPILLLDDVLAEHFGVDVDSISSENISSTISGEMRRQSLIAVAVAALFMMLYIWVRFKDIRFASSAIIALIHDVLVVLALYAIARISVGSAFIACMLTIVGYSINATIVIYDRIREVLRDNQYNTIALEIGRAHV